MNNKILAIALFGMTAAAVAYFPEFGPQSGNNQSAQQPVDREPVLSTLNEQSQPIVEVAFVLDTTGSMGGLIQTAKDKIWSIASTLAAADPAPRIRMGLVAYRDRGDDYVTRVIDLTTDLDSIQSALYELRAQGGGDGPEAVNDGLHDALHKLSWTSGGNAYRAIFLVGDAPPHMDYQDDVKYPVTVKAAAAAGIRVNAIQCGASGETRNQWERIAQAGNGSYLQVAQAGGAVALASPYDAKLAKLSEELDATRTYYGSDAERSESERKRSASKKLYEAAPAPAMARRATFMADDAGKDALLGHKELIDEVTSGRVDLDALDSEELPESMRALSAEERRALVTERQTKRESLKSEIQDLAQKRNLYLREAVAAEGGAKDSLDHKLYGTVRKQALEEGLGYSGEEPAY